MTEEGERGKVKHHYLVRGAEGRCGVVDLLRCEGALNRHTTFLIRPIRKIDSFVNRGSLALVPAARHFSMWNGHGRKEGCPFVSQFVAVAVGTPPAVPVPTLAQWRCGGVFSVQSTGRHTRADVVPVTRDTMNSLGEATTVADEWRGVQQALSLSLTHTHTHTRKPMHTRLMSEGDWIQHPRPIQPPPNLTACECTHTHTHTQTQAHHTAGEYSDRRKVCECTQTQTQTQSQADDARTRASKWSENMDAEVEVDPCQWSARGMQTHMHMHVRACQCVLVAERGRQTGGRWMRWTLWWRCLGGGTCAATVSPPRT